MSNIKEISPEQANEYLKVDALLIDVREGDEVDALAFNVPCVTNVAYSLFDQNYKEIPNNRNLIFACHLGVRSLNAAQYLAAQGWDADKIFSLQGGIDAWSAAKLPTIKPNPNFTMAKLTETGGGCCGGGSNGSCC
jgi:rhodanese-related sulfurtransferase